MLPFVSGARSLRYIRSNLKFSTKLRKNIGRACQVKHARTVSILGVADKQCLNNKIQDILNRNDVTRPLSTPAYNLSAVCSSIMLLNCDGGATALTTALGTGDDDEVTTSAGKKRKHWIKHDVKG
ncbi:uncharacterized protein LOC114529011 [Dendronephthya gigantea]|uniref:uncharacterized protein LOC114529011 n=1 Tax=Dendronephthya gigantea TaxID=151771 RepID=UPI00106A17F5|nr:uncharacterized protein LOC114529011 [Dendronephthya gigantea]